MVAFNQVNFGLKIIEVPWRYRISSITDKCIMHWIVQEEVFIIVIYIDDILIIAQEDELERGKELFIQEFQWIMMETSTTLSYLGMLIKIHPDHILSICHLTFEK